MSHYARLSELFESELDELVPALSAGQHALKEEELPALDESLKEGFMDSDMGFEMKEGSHGSFDEGREELRSQIVLRKFVNRVRFKKSVEIFRLEA